MDVSTLAGILAERLLAYVPHLDKVFFTNSGVEAVEAAMKFARAATGRPGIVYCDHAFHGLTYGALSLNGDANFRDGFEPLLPGCLRVPFDDLPALERALSTREVAAFIVEPIQGKGVNMPSAGYLKDAAALCRRHGTLFVADEIQTGLGRTGRFLAVEHWGVEPDMVLLAKALSGGHVPSGAVLTRKAIHDKVFDRMDRAVVHGSTFAKNDLAMAAGIATLDVLESEKLIKNAARKGERLLGALNDMVPRYELLKEVRGKGLMIGIEFGEPSSFKLKASWNVLEGASKGLFCQLITIPLFKDHKSSLPGRGSQQPYDQAAAVVRHDGRRLRLDRRRIRCGDCPGAPRSGGGLVARQNAGQQCGARPNRPLAADLCGRVGELEIAEHAEMVGRDTVAAVEHDRALLRRQVATRKYVVDALVSDRRGIDVRVFARPGKAGLVRAARGKAVAKSCAAGGQQTNRRRIRIVVEIAAQDFCFRRTRRCKARDRCEQHFGLRLTLGDHFRPPGQMRIGDHKRLASDRCLR